MTYSVLSDQAILREMAAHHIVIDPFCPENLSTSSYDVTLGKYYYREQVPKPNPGGTFMYNPYSRKEVERIWGTPQEATCLSKCYHKKCEGIHPDDLVIFVEPGETILAHTNEFIGGLHDITTMMKARSSFGRNFIEICKCAGWGDVGYVNRWTMEITNNSQYYAIPLIVGRRIAQIIFFKTEGILDDKHSYPDFIQSKYQTVRNVSELQEKWYSSDMLPRLYLDQECVRSVVKPPDEKVVIKNALEPATTGSKGSKPIGPEAVTTEATTEAATGKTMPEATTEASTEAATEAVIAATE